MLVCQFGHGLRLTYSLCGRQRFVLRWFDAMRPVLGGEFDGLYFTLEDAMLAAERFNAKNSPRLISFPVRYDEECFN